MGVPVPGASGIGGVDPRAALPEGGDWRRTRPTLTAPVAEPSSPRPPHPESPGDGQRSKEAGEATYGWRGRPRPTETCCLSVAGVDGREVRDLADEYIE